MSNFLILTLEPIQQNDRMTATFTHPVLGDCVLEFAITELGAIHPYMIQYGDDNHVEYFDCPDKFPFSNLFEIIRQLYNK